MSFPSATMHAPVNVAMSTTSWLEKNGNSSVKMDRYINRSSKHAVASAHQPHFPHKTQGHVGHRLCDTLLLAVEERISQGEATLGIRVVHLSPARAMLEPGMFFIKNGVHLQMDSSSQVQKIPQKNKEQQTNHPSISLSFRSSLLMRCDTMGEFFLDSFRPPNGILPSVANRMDIPLIVREHIFDEINLQRKHFSVEA